MAQTKKPMNKKPVTKRERIINAVAAANPDIHRRRIESIVDLVRALDKKPGRR